MRDLLLIFAYYYPPMNAIGGVRPHRFAKYLSRLGVESHVFTAADAGGRPHLKAETIDDPFITHPRQGIGWQVERAIRRFSMPGVTGIRWGRRAFEAASRFIDSQPACRITILSTYPPMGTPLAGYWLSKKRRLPWILDLRDPIAGNPAIALTRFQEGSYRFLERRFVKNAASVIANTDAVQARLKANYPEQAAKIHLLWNGFDPEQRLTPTPIPEREQRVYSHIGELYEGRVITPLLLAIDRLIDAGRVSPAKLQIHLVGPIRGTSVPSPEFMTNAQNKGWLKLTPQVPQAEAQRLMQESDGLLLVQPHSDVQVPGKLFEYVQIGRPVFAYILRNTPIERILRQSNTPHVCGYASNGPESLDEPLNEFFQLDSKAVEPSDWFENGFNAQKHAQQLFDLIQRVNR
jgi:glycosyltransferase involved in cell wall biosynthesis